MFLPLASALAQAPLPAPARTIYKCQVKQKIVYSDEPCLGAQRLEAVPTRGVNRLSGSVRTGEDVRREHYTEQLAQAWRPLSGKTTAEYERAGRRSRLSAESQQECRHLESAILQFEQAEKQSRAPDLQLVQQELFDLRKRYKTLRC